MPQPKIVRKIAKAMAQWHRPDLPMLTWTEFVEGVKSIDILADEVLIEKAVGCLHESGKVRKGVKGPFVILTYYFYNMVQ